MSQFKELRNNLRPNYITLKEQVSHPNTVWRRILEDPVTGADSDNVWWCHPILTRATEDARYSKVESSLIGLATNAVTEILLDNNISFETFHRIAINNSARQAERYAPQPHVDHSFPYKHVIIYLNQSDGDTVMYNTKGQVIDKSRPKEDKVIYFGKCNHTGYFPMEHAERLILVATFS